MWATASPSMSFSSVLVDCRTAQHQHFLFVVAQKRHLCKTLKLDVRCAKVASLLHLGSSFLLLKTMSCTLQDTVLSLSNGSSKLACTMSPSCLVSCQRLGCTPFRANSQARCNGVTACPLPIVALLAHSCLTKTCVWSQIGAGFVEQSRCPSQRSQTDLQHTRTMDSGLNSGVQRKTQCCLWHPQDFRLSNHNPI